MDITKSDSFSALLTKGKKLTFASKNDAVKILSMADRARDLQQYNLAASLYDCALSYGDRNFDLLLQCGHMHKEAHNYVEAESRYLKALGLQPRNAEILLQLGHFYKVSHRPRDAERFYREAAVAKPDWLYPREELKLLLESEAAKRAEAETNAKAETGRLAEEEISARGIGGLVDKTLFPKTRDELYELLPEAFIFTRNGNHQKTEWGTGQTVRGVDALRGYIRSQIPYLYLEIYLDGKPLHTCNFVVAPQRRDKSGTEMKKYAYNAWIDFSDFSRGWHELVFRGVNVRGDVREGIDWRRERVVVAEPMATSVFSACDGIIPPLDGAPEASVVEKVNAMPSVIRPASTGSFPGPIGNVLIIRPDQLGDMVVSVPALTRLRELLPHSRITGLVGPGNEELAHSLGIFDELIVVDFPDDAFQRQRVMDRRSQEALARKLKPYKFDVAIDFPVSGVSYKLLPLTGAPITMGYGGEGNKTLDLNLSTHDPTTNNDVMRHSARTRALIETLALWIDSGAKVQKRSDLSRDLLLPYGVSADDRFIVLHSGSRIKFTQWPYYTELANRISSQLNYKVVFMAEHGEMRQKLSQEALANGGIIYMDEILPFDVFDAFLSFCHIFVGNDSGPKHLAGLRGAKVISLHSSRIGWSEWGQEHTGVVISRRVPCAGCSLHHDPEECAQGVACITNITVDEVFGEVEKMAIA